MNLISKVILVSCLLSNISLIIASYSVTNWAVINSSESLSLYSCSTCETFKENWTYECLARSICSLNTLHSQCSLYNDLYKASYSYLTLEFASLLMSIIFLEKLLYLCFNKFPGPRLTIYFSGILMFVFHTLATALWLSFSRAGKNCPLSASSSRPDICIGTGAILAISNIALMLLTLILFSVLHGRDDLPLQQEVIPGKVLKIPGDWLSWGCLVFAAFYTVLILASLTVTDWVTAQGYKGSLVRCKDCDSVEWLSWNCLKSEFCELNPQSAECSNYRSLGRASDIFIIIQGACIVLLALYLQYIVGIIKRSLYGSLTANYLVPILLLIGNLVGTILWFSFSGAKTMCNSTELCAEVGPSLAIISNIVLLPSVFVFLAITCRRRTIEFTQTVALKHYNSLALSNLGSLNLDDTNLVKLGSLNLDETNLAKPSSMNLEESSLVKPN